MKSSLLRRASIVGIAALTLAIIVPAGASADDGKTDTIAGYTKAEFVAAARDQGVDPAIADDAWGDRNAMAAIPVSSTSNEGDHESIASAQRATYTSHSGTCAKKWNNLFGWEVLRVTVKKSWRTTSGKVTNPSSQFTGTAGFPYVYDGQVGSNDWYGVYNTHHNTYRQGKFTDNLTGYQLNASVNFNARSYGGYSCTFTGGL